jgi:predicted SAM-dependent methyltransferase
MNEQLHAAARIDLACGQRKREGFLGVDAVATEGVDVVCDLTEFPWPFESGCAEEVHCSHYVEHTPDLVAFMDELWRICKDGARVTIVHPYLKSDEAFQDPTHRRFISDRTWWYFNREWREKAGVGHYPMRSDFDVESVDHEYVEPWDEKPPVEQLYAVVHHWNVLRDLTVVLRARKPASS